MRVSQTTPAVTAINQNLDVKASVRVATAAALATNTRSGNVLTASGNASLNTAGIDSVTTLAVGDRVLVKDESTGANKGIYTITDLGSVSTPWILTRATDADASAKVTTGLFTFVEEGTTNASTGWILTTANPITLNTTSLSFTQFTGAGEITAGAGITKSGNTLSVSAAQTSISSITAPTNTTLTLATLDNNKDVVITPHGTGKLLTTISSSGVQVGAAVQNTAVTSGAKACFLLSAPNSSNGNARDWMLATNYNTTGDLMFLVGAVGATPATNGLGLSKSGDGTFNGSVSTAAPSGGTAAAWKLGTVASVSPTSPNRTIELDVGGTRYLDRKSVV